MTRFVVPVTNVTVHPGNTDTSTAVLIGDPATAWRDDNDGTHARVQVSSTTSFYGWAEATALPAELPYMNPKRAKVSVEMRVSGGNPRRIAVRIESASTLLGWADDPATPWPVAPGWLTLPVVEYAPISSPEEMARWARAGTLNAEVRPPNVAGYYNIYELRFVFDTGQRLHPCRQFPRADGLAASSARRHYPPDESWQASPRWRGGYY